MSATDRPTLAPATPRPSPGRPSRVCIATPELGPSQVGGIAHYTLLARRQGLAFAGTAVCVGVHGPSLWLPEAGGRLLDDLDLIEADALERRCVELADAVWSPRRDVLGWMRRRGWPGAER